ncbi:MAG: hypothetical protein ACLP59_07725 [Bryobacteraceae bacterium]
MHDTTPNPSQARIQANRQNAKKSTGPRTAAGKAATSRNALTHGLTAQTYVLPGDDPEEFTALLDDLFRRFHPDGPAEERLVRRIAANQWRLDRAFPLEAAVLRARLRNGASRLANRHAQAQQIGNPQPGLDPDDAAALAIGFIIDCQEANSLVKLARYEAALERSIDRSLRQLAAFQSARSAPPETKNYETNPIPGGARSRASSQAARLGLSTSDQASVALATCVLPLHPNG